jgi:hypothetical protein
MPLTPSQWKEEMEEMIEEIYYDQGIEIIMKRYPCVSYSELDLKTIVHHFNDDKLPKFVINLVGTSLNEEEHKMILEYGYSRVLVQLFYELIDYLTTYHRERCGKIIKYLQREGVSLEPYEGKYKDPVKIVACILMHGPELKAVKRAKKGLRATKEECAPYENETPLTTLHKEIEEESRRMMTTWQTKK